MDLSITITPIEGRRGSKPKTVKCFYDANTELYQHSRIHDAPERGNGYLKTAVSVTLDGVEFDCSYDMVAGGAESGTLFLYPDLKKTLIDRFRFYAGLKRPRHMTAENYEAFLDTYVMRKEADQYKELIDKLEAM